MIVLKKGKADGWEIKQKCSGRGNGGAGCKARLLINENDVFRTYIRDEDTPGFPYDFYTFECPICGTKTDIPLKKVPYRIKIKAKKNRSYEKEEL
jgi:rRNA maturation protein Nop10